LRLEDIDPLRCKPEFAEAIFADLRWLGLQWPEPVMRQSGRVTVYAAAAERLRTAGLLYPCFCSRREIAERAIAADPDGAPLYPGTCRGRREADCEALIRQGERPQWRLRMDEAITRAGSLQFIEAGQTREAKPERWGDAVLLRKDTPTSYHLSVVVDDAAQEITDVTRGVDLFAATDLHVLLQHILGLQTPNYQHHRLILDPAEGQKLSKSRGSPSLRSLRESGWTPADLRRHLGFT